MSTEIETTSIRAQDVCKLLDEMAESMVSTRQAIQKLNEKPDEDLQTKDGISLLSLKHQVFLSYLHSLVLVSSRKVLGDSLTTRTPPSESFSDPERSARGSELGDMVDRMVEGRLVLEKVKALEGRMKYQIEKLVKVAQEGQKEEKDVINDPLAFRPNPQNLATNNDSDDEDKRDSDDEGQTHNDGIYRPPRVAPTPYLPQTTSKSKSKKDRTAPLPSSLATILHSDGTTPHAESSSGLGGAPAFNMLSSRARYLNHLTEFEEEQFGRVMMGKKEARRRARDERDLALGGDLTGVGEEGRGGRRRGTAGGWEDEFGDVLRDVGRASRPGGGDAYEELRRKGKKAGVLERSRDTQKKRKVVGVIDDRESVGGKRKRSRFESERKNVKKKSRKSV